MAAMITRTVVGTKVVAKVVSKETDEVQSIETVLSKAVDNDKDATKLLAKALPSDLVIIRIESIEKVEKLYGVTVADFMSVAVELDPATRKPLTATPAEN